MIGSIFFQPRPTRDGVNALIYTYEGRLIASHHMTVEGARVRLHDFEAAIEDAEWDQELDAVLHLVDSL